MNKEAFFKVMCKAAETDGTEVISTDQQILNISGFSCEKPVLVLCCHPAPPYVYAKGLSTPGILVIYWRGPVNKAAFAGNFGRNAMGTTRDALGVFNQARREPYAGGIHLDITEMNSQ